MRVSTASCHDPACIFPCLTGLISSGLVSESIWVYILERRRAVEVWESVMGDRGQSTLRPGAMPIVTPALATCTDPELARISAPDSLRALYGKSPYENAVRVQMSSSRRRSES